ncbi:MAG: sensor histidine kinase [Acidimicrobiales bacterium]
MVAGGLVIRQHSARIAAPAVIAVVLAVAGLALVAVFGESGALGDVAVQAAAGGIVAAGLLVSLGRWIWSRDGDAQGVDADTGATAGGVMTATKQLRAAGPVHDRTDEGATGPVADPDHAPDFTASPGSNSGPGTGHPSPDGSAVDGPALDGPALDGPALDGPAFGGPALDGPGLDGAGADGPGFDGCEVDGPGSEGAAPAGRGSVDDLTAAVLHHSLELVDQQLVLLDQLEAGEQDPARLELLFSVDHLATRIRRHAENLLIVAGVPEGSTAGGVAGDGGEPVRMIDTLRAAVGQVEDYRAVVAHRVADTTLAASTSQDLARLVAELIDNACAASPEGAAVDIKGIPQPDGCYLLAVVDHGRGLSPAQIEQVNRGLADPALADGASEQSIGLAVVGLLARRHGIGVELASPTGSGITALVLIPASELLSPADMAAATPGKLSPPPPTSPRFPVPPAAEQRSSDGAPSPTPGQVPAPGVLADGRDRPGHQDLPDHQGNHDHPVAPPVEPAPEPIRDPVARLRGDGPVAPLPSRAAAAAGPPARLADALPTGDRFDAGVASLLAPAEDPAGATTPEAHGRTASGLVRRTRSSAPVPSAPGEHRTVAASRRSPEEKRAMYGRYRRGRHRTMPHPSNPSSPHPSDPGAAS